MKTNKSLLCTLSVIASGFLLTLIGPAFGLSFLAWVAWVPFILVCSPRVKGKSFFIILYIISLCYWLGNLYWMGLVTWPGWAAFCLYIALLWPLLGFTIGYCRIKKLPLFILVPILIVGAERLQGLFLGGFYWRHLSHSQYANTSLIQIADIFGAGAVSLVVAMVNGLLAELLIAVQEKKLLKSSNFIKTGIVIAVVVAVILYGRFRINQAEAFIEQGPLVACVQSNVPQFVKKSHQGEEQILADLLKHSNESIKTGAKLVVWPETMVQTTLDKRVLNRLDSAYSCHIVNNILKEHARDAAYVLVGAYGGKLKESSLELGERYNSAFLYQPDGTQAEQQYNKIHLVPFGEVVPFKKSCSFLHGLLMKFTPYDYDYSLNYGTEYTVFEMKNDVDGNKSHRFGVMICYENTVPLIARRFVNVKSGSKRVDWLLNISNDGWFVRFTDERVCPTTELAEHTAICVFRAVENRVAVFRSVNTGISCLIDTLGRITSGFDAGTLPKKAMDRQGMAGWFADKVPIDKRTTFFSRYGQWLDFCCAVCFAFFAAAALVEPRIKPGKTGAGNERI